MVFTSGGTGTEANNLALRDVTALVPAGRGRIVVSAVEHLATTAPCALLEGQGWVITRPPVVQFGMVGPDAPARAHGAIVRTDAAEAIAKIPADVGALGADLLSIVGRNCHPQRASSPSARTSSHRSPSSPPPPGRPAPRASTPPTPRSPPWASPQT